MILVIISIVETIVLVLPVNALVVIVNSVLLTLITLPWTTNQPAIVISALLHLSVTLFTTSHKSTMVTVISPTILKVHVGTVVIVVTAPVMPILKLMGASFVKPVDPTDIPV